MKVEFFTDKILKHAKTLDIETRDHITHLTYLLEKYGSEIRMPYSKPFGDGIFELRVLGKTNVRFLYCFYKNTAYVLHIVIKKQNKLEKQDILLARNRKSLLA